MTGFLYDFALRPLDIWIIRRLRNELISTAKGETLEVGAGTGLNFKYYQQAVSRLVAIEPDPSMRARAESRRATVKTEVSDGNVEALPYANEQFDSVVATLVFCSVEHPEIGFQEIKRVLKPGGHLLLLEHVRRNSPVAGKVLDRLTPLWSKIAGGCHLNRNHDVFLRSLGFEIIECRSVWKNFGKMWILRKPG